MLYLLYLVGGFITRIIPVTICYFLAEIVGRVYYLFAKNDRVELADNLRIILGKDKDEKLINKHIRRIFVNFGKYLVDFFKFSRFTKEYLTKKIKMIGVERLNDYIAEGKGVILVSLHLGNWELGGAVLAAMGYPTNAIVLEHKDKRINAFFVNQREINNMKGIPLGFQLKQCFKVLKNNEILAIVGDKDYTLTGEYMEFFGHEALMPKGPAVLSLKTGAPIIACCVPRNEDDTFNFVFDAPEKYTPTGNFDEDVKNIMKSYLAIFEKYIKNYPNQWYAFKRVWKQ